MCHYVCVCNVCETKIMHILRKSGGYRLAPQLEPDNYEAGPTLLSITNTNKAKQMIADFRGTRNKPNTVSILGKEVCKSTWTVDWTGNVTPKLCARRDRADCTS